MLVGSPILSLLSTGLQTLRIKPWCLGLYHTCKQPSMQGITKQIMMCFSFKLRSALFPSPVILLLIYPPNSFFPCRFRDCAVYETVPVYYTLVLTTMLIALMWPFCMERHVPLIVRITRRDETFDCRLWWGFLPLLTRNCFWMDEELGGIVVCQMSPTVKAAWNQYWSTNWYVTHVKNVVTTWVWDVLCLFTLQD